MALVNNAGVWSSACVEWGKMDTYWIHNHLFSIGLKPMSKQSQLFKTLAQKFPKHLTRHLLSPAYVTNAVCETLTIKELKTCVLDGHLVFQFLFRLVQFFSSVLFYELV